MIAAGIVIIMKTEWFLSFFGRIAWAETHLGGEGGTRIFYKLLGLGFIFISFMLMTGSLENIAEKIFLRN